MGRTLRRAYSGTEGVLIVKVVLFCGGFGLRMREASERIPKPLIPVGQEPILLHIMKYYAHFGHTEFILCLGYQGDMIRSYFQGGRDEVLDSLVLPRAGGASERPGPGR